MTPCENRLRTLGVLIDAHRAAIDASDEHTRKSTWAAIEWHIEFMCKKVGLDPSPMIYYINSLGIPGGEPDRIWFTLSLATAHHELVTSHAPIQYIKSYFTPQSEFTSCHIGVLAYDDKGVVNAVKAQIQWVHDEAFRKETWMKEWAAY